ncbi:hypothetical protein HDV00_003165 [Rhizophlyctis rosea]|nr:hypothetical protein HDV00_003165 [Rhizophlyctis rosea]
MSANQLKSVLRLGAKAVAHAPSVFENFLKVDIDSILEASRAHQKHVDAGGVKEEKEEEAFVLEGMEQVKTAMWDGQIIDRSKGKTNRSIADEWRDLAKRERKERVVQIGTHRVLAETVGNAEWEAVATLAGKDPRLAEPKKQKLQFERQTIHPIGDTLPELMLLGYPHVRMAYWIRCPECLRRFKENPKALRKVESKMKRDQEKLDELDRDGGEARDDDDVVEVASVKGKEKEGSHTHRVKNERDHSTPSAWSDTFRAEIKRVMKERGVGWEELFQEVQALLPEDMVVDKRSWTVAALKRTVSGSDKAHWILKNEDVQEAVGKWVERWEEQEEVEEQLKGEEEGSWDGDE